MAITMIQAHGDPPFFFLLQAIPPCNQCPIALKKLNHTSSALGVSGIVPFMETDLLSYMDNQLLASRGKELVSLHWSPHPSKVNMLTIFGFDANSK